MEQNKANGNWGIVVLFLGFAVFVAFSVVVLYAL